LGELLAGKLLDAKRLPHGIVFVSQSKEVCIKGNNYLIKTFADVFWRYAHTLNASHLGNWQKIKVILKATCGGKKKDSGFSLRPSFTTWECNRL
jgi:hypothetical protein